MERVMFLINRRFCGKVVEKVFCDEVGRGEEVAAVEAVKSERVEHGEIRATATSGWVKSPNC
jgi:hypothetical protein